MPRKAGTGPKRTRNWTFIVYPDSAPENWFEVLSEEHVPGYVSPLHDQDVNPDGEPKKPHWHVMLNFAGVKTIDQVREITERLNATEPQVVKNARGVARYMCHLDNPEKAQYDPNEVRSIAGADYLAHMESDLDVDTILHEVQVFCRDNGVYSYSSICDYAYEHHREWYRVITSSRIRAITQYLKSLKWDAEREAN